MRAVIPTNCNNSGDMVVPFEIIHENIINALNQSSDIILTIYDQTTYILQYITPNIEEIFSFQPRELIGTKLYSLHLHTKRYHRRNKYGQIFNIEKILMTTLPNGNILLMERILPKDNSMLTIDTNLTPMLIINSSGNILWSNHFIENIFGQNQQIGGTLQNYLDKVDDFPLMIDQLINTKSELVRYPLKVKHQDESSKSVEIDSITTYHGNGEFLHTTLFFFEPSCPTPPPSKFNCLSLEIQLPPPPPPSSPVQPLDLDELSRNPDVLLNLDDGDLKPRRSTPRVKVASLETQFLAQMSHDIRTPVSGIIGMTSLLQMTCLTPEQKEFVDTIESSSSLLLALLNDILDISKIEAGKVELECIPFSLSKVVRDCVKTLSVEASKRDIPIIIHSNPPFSDSMSDYLGDPNRIKQILMNFLSNAVKFTIKGQIEIIVTVSPLEENSSNLNYFQDHDEIRIEVKDTGIGIEDTNKLFSPFVQAALSTSRMYGGTGLGLSICKQLADIMGGHVGVRSKLDEGTSIWVTLSLERYKDDRVRNGESSTLHSLLSNSDVTNQYQLPSDWRTTCSLLVAEDNVVNRKLLMHMLKRLGFQNIEMVINGKEVVDLIAKSLQSSNKQQYHLILMDCQMPELDGYDATRIIREMEAEILRVGALSASSSPQNSPSSSDVPFSLSVNQSIKRISHHIPIVALTANASDSDRQVCLSCGMDDFCTKPLTIEKLDDIVSRWISYSWSNF